MDHEFNRKRIPVRQVQADETEIPFLEFRFSRNETESRRIRSRLQRVKIRVERRRRRENRQIRVK